MVSSKTYCLRRQYLKTRNLRTSSKKDTDLNFRQKVRKHELQKNTGFENKCIEKRERQEKGSIKLTISNTIKLLYNDHPRDPKFVAVVDRWSFRGRSM